MHPLSRFVFAVAFTAALAGCATTSNVPLANPTAQVGAYRDTIDLEGKLSANYEKDGQPQSVTVNFTWLQRPGNIDVSLFSPLGQTVALVNVTPTAATLTQSGRAAGGKGHRYPDRENAGLDVARERPARLAAGLCRGGRRQAFRRVT
jgi:outer membrane lipoprotein LolB